MAKVKSVSKVESKPTFDEIKSWFDERMHPSKIDFDDPAPYEVYSKGKFAGVFQCTQPGAQRLFMNAKPEGVIEVATLTSIYRPGPLAANVDKLYIESKQGKQYDWGDKRINEILAPTNGLLIFQEQVMLLAEKCAGFPKDRCDEVRRAIMKRSISGGEAAKKAAQETREGFVNGCIANGYSESVANGLYDRILFFAGYGFNKTCHFSEPVKTYDQNGGSESTKRLIDVEPGEYVRSRDERTHNDVFVRVVAKHDHGEQPLVTVELVTGERVRCTWDHKFRVQETGEMLPLWMIYDRGLSIVVEK